MTKKGKDGMDTTSSSNQHYFGPILSTHPLGYIELIKRSLRLYFASFSKVIMLSFILSVIVFIPRLISYILGYDILTSFGRLDINILWILVLDFFSLLLMITIFWRLHCVAHYKQEGFKEDFNVGIHKVLYVFVAVIIQSIIVFGISGLTFLLQILLYKHHLLFTDNSSISWQLVFTILIFFGQAILILFLFTLFIFLTPLIAIENEHIFQSIRRSISLTWNHWWRVFYTIISPWIFFVFFSLFIKFFVGLDIHIYFVNNQQGITIGPILLQMALFALFVIWPTSLLYVQLKDLELRKKAEA